MSADVLLSRLDRVRRSGRGTWRARCPVHGGRNPASLGVRELDDGTLLLKCFAHGCSAGEIVGALGLELHDLFPERLPEGQHHRPRERRPWRAEDILAAVAEELAVSVVIIHDLAHGAPITSDLRDRLLLAAARLARAEGIAHG